MRAMIGPLGRSERGSVVQQRRAFLGAGFQQAGIAFRTAFDFARLNAVGAVADAMAGDGRQDTAAEFGQFLVASSQQPRTEIVESLHGASEAQLPRCHLELLSG